MQRNIHFRSNTNCQIHHVKSSMTRIKFVHANDSNEIYSIVKFKIHKMYSFEMHFSLTQCCKYFSIPTVSTDLKLDDTEYSKT